MEINQAKGDSADRRLDTSYRESDFIGQQYEVIRILGKGGFGIVYLVSTGKNKLLFALKTFRDEYLVDSKTRERFTKEANIWVDLWRHPCIVRAISVDEISGRLFICMEYIAPNNQGLNSLDGYLKNQPPDLSQSLRWAIQICHGMEYAKSKGIRSHRDLKPANILIDQNGTAKITDFGLAVVLSESRIMPAARLSWDKTKIGLSGQTIEGAIFGTPTYMPPEQFENAADCDERSDIYSFGIVLYQMIARGRLPFLAPIPRNNLDKEMMQFWNEMRRLHNDARVPRLDSPLFPIIQRCLEKDPIKRYQNFYQLRSDLDPIYKHETGIVVSPPQQMDLEGWEWSLKGVSLSSLGRYDEAFRAFDRALEFNPEDTDALNNKGWTFCKLGRYEEAIRCFDQALEYIPDDANTWNNKGNSLDSLGHYEDAIRCFEKALEINPRFAAAWSNKGDSLIHLGYDEKAISCFNRALELDPRLLAAWLNKGSSLSKLGKYEEAIRCSNIAIELNPQEVKAINNKGLSLNRLGQYEEAVLCYDKALEIAPGYFEAWNHKGNSLDNLGRFEEAIYCYDKAMEINPQFFLGWIGKGTSLDKLGRHEEAIQCYNKVLEMDPNYAGAWCNKGIALNNLGRADEALQCYDRALDLDAHNLGAWANKGDILMERKRTEEAITCYKNALEIDPQEPNVLGKWAVAVETIGPRGAAIIAWRKYLEVARNFPSYREKIPYVEKHLRILESS